MTDSKRVLITALLDRSGSMAFVKDATIEAFDAFIKAQRDATDQLGQRCEVTLVQFDTDDAHEVVYQGKDIHDVPSLTLEPRGGTPLNDALGHAVVLTGEWLAAIDEDWRPGLVYFVVLTDGQENSSREWTHAQVRELITRQSERYSWEFHFLGVGIDAFAVGGGYNFPVANIYRGARTAEGSRAVYGAAAQSIVTHRTKNV